jgi:hypothetical protein
MFATPLHINKNSSNDNTLSLQFVVFSSRRQKANEQSVSIANSSGIKKSRQKKDSKRLIFISFYFQATTKKESCHSCFI